MQPDVISADTLDVPYSYWEYIIRHLWDGGYIAGVTFRSVIGGGQSTGVRNPEITPDGIAYLSGADGKTALESLCGPHEAFPGA